MRDAAKLGLDDNFWPDPDYVLAPFLLRQNERRAIDAQRAQTPPQIPRGLMRVPGP